MGDKGEILDIKIADIKATAPHFQHESVALAHALTKLNPSDEELREAAWTLGLSEPPPSGVSLRQWLTDLQGILTHHAPTSMAQGDVSGCGG